ncbi:hypothetical protein GCM10029976_062840 [Kribbella albertanoniae]|uniref:Uncharacterized protein n=1 Tax=Kribbella albertanoniae TaxID=1266829 RepID=A0A4R4P0G4_9ACTN|nr:hypothetical protein [Kribbella albertanoniae]TDC15698.1 hypothetical protein E1261_40065 [Kribbella albertanoniae]
MTTPKVLVIGLDPHRIPGPFDPAPVDAAIAAADTSFRDHGIEAHNCLVGLDGTDDIPAVTAALQSHPWDCVLIGAGIRRNEELLPLFEQLLNLVHHHAPTANLALNQGLNDITESTLRHLPFAD